MQPYQQPDGTWESQVDPSTTNYPPPSAAGNAQPPAPPYQQQHYQPLGYQQPGYQQPGYQAPEAQPPSYQAPSYQAPGYQQPGYGQPSYEQPGPTDGTPAYLRTTPEARQALAQRGTRDIVFGCVWLVVGLAITGFTFAYFEGAAMIVAWGPALYGLYKIIKGMVTLARNS